MALGFIDASGGLGPQADPNSSPPQAPSGGPGVNGQNANCNWIDDDCAQTGGVGGPGSRGIDGVPGGPGGNGGSIDFEADVINGSVQFLVRGGRGGQGQRGGQGGNGGKGGRGGDGDDCEFGRHGGSGGPSGSGGAGGAGGRGGNGGSIFVRVRTDNTPAFGNDPPLDARGGDGGLGGQGGAPGAPRPPGDDGVTSGVFSSSSDCPNMGPVPGFGTPGVPGATGPSGGAGNGGSVAWQIVR